MPELLAKRVRIEPKIYAYEICTQRYRGLLKVGTTVYTVKSRVQQQLSNIKMPFAPDYYKIVPFAYSFLNLLAWIVLSVLLSP